MWGWLVGAVRDQLRPLGWVAHEQSNYPLTVHSALNLAIAVASGDSYVGNLLGMPSSRSRKGKNTVDAMQSGIYWGYIGLIEGTIKRISEEMAMEKGERPFIIATGGLAPLFDQGTDMIDAIDDDLTMKGLVHVQMHLSEQQKRKSA
jgi:hypothetical protein